MDSVSSSTATAQSSSLANSRSTIAGNFDQFLQLLTTQLKNQSPLEPLDTNQFTQQLVQFSGVEQQLKTNELLDNMITGTRVSAATGAVSFIGQRVVADGATSPLLAGTADKPGKAEWKLEAARSASRAKIEIKTTAGTVVYSTERDLTAGSQVFEWDGLSTAGVKQQPGEYTISVTAKDSAGSALNVTSQMTGIVDGVDFSSDNPILRVGALSVPIANVKSITRPGVN
jgi:flagellar basal-body rod modification protein FlgD